METGGTQQHPRGQGRSGVRKTSDNEFIRVVKETLDDIGFAGDDWSLRERSKFRQSNEQRSKKTGGNSHGHRRKILLEIHANASESCRWTQPRCRTSWTRADAVRAHRAEAKERGGPARRRQCGRWRPLRRRGDCELAAARARLRGYNHVERDPMGMAPAMESDGAKACGKEGLAADVGRLSL